MTTPPTLPNNFAMLITMNADMPADISEVTLGNVLMNGAYVGSKSREDIEALATSKCGAIVVGSISVKERSSNPGQGYWLHKERLYSLNSFGMPNGGMPYFQKYLPAMVEVAHKNKKPLIANLIGFSKEEFVDLIKLARDSGADMAELNFGCPNVWEAGQQKRIISYHADLLKANLEYIKKQKINMKLIAKISPLPPDILFEVANVIADSGIIHAVTATNSYPNASLSTGTKVPGQNDEVFAGLAGRALKPISVGVVRQLHRILPSQIDIIGCGGISTINDVNDYLRAGAKAVQIATALVNDGLSVFEKILYQHSRVAISAQ